MRVGWIADYPKYTGGAEIAARRFMDARPDGTKIVPSAPDSIPEDVDVYVIHNCVEYGADIIPYLSKKPVVKYIHDVWPHGDDDLRQWLLENALIIYSSKLQKENLHHVTDPPPGLFIPPPIPYDQLRNLSHSPNRSGTVWISRISLEKGYKNVARWAEENDTVVDAYGMRMGLVADLPRIRLHRPVPPGQVPQILASSERLIHLPIEIEPFGLSVAEGWAAGCELVVNDRVGAKWWIENYPESIVHSTEFFWNYVKEHSVSKVVLSSDRY